MKKVWVIAMFLSLLLISACSSILNSSELGISSDSLDFLDKDTIETNIINESYSSIDQLLQANFTLADTISEGSNETSKIYATSLLTINELSTLFESNTEPVEISELKDNKQILVYPNGILTLQVDEVDSDIILLEFATKDFVRNHYSPSFFDGYLALFILDEVLDVDDWGKKRYQSCSNGGCYGGYLNTNKYRSGDVGSLRGSTNRGGGPSAGK